MSEPKAASKKPLQGKTYSLFGSEAESAGYYALIKELAEGFLSKLPDEKKLLALIRKAHSTGLYKRLPEPDRALLSLIRKSLKTSLSVYTANVKGHLKTLPISKRFDETLRTKEEQYHLYMIEIELVNRIYKESFKAAEYKFALLPHCLRDFRPKCCAVPGDIEALCKGCTEDCFINLGSVLLKKYNINPFIAVEMDQEGLFKKLKAAHPSIGALGVACVPELAMGMRLCIKLGIPPVGIPLDANRCARWMGEARESSFNLPELENLIK